MERKLLTLCLVTKGDHILLGQKKRGFGQGHWNGFGGKVEKGETIDQGAMRELQEESGLVALEMHERGRLLFTFEKDPIALEVHVFQVTNFSGSPQETEEMSPRWFLLNEIPYDEMWADDRHWFPLFLEGKYFTGEFHFTDLATIDHLKVISFSSFEELV